MFRRIGDLLDRDKQLSPVTRWHERLQRINAALQPLLPVELQRVVRVGSQEGQRLTLFARHAAAAARLRQLTPRLAAALRGAGIPVLEIQVKVDTGLIATRPMQQRQLSPKAQAALEALQTQLPDGPLKAAVAALRNKARKS